MDMMTSRWRCLSRSVDDGGLSGTGVGERERGVVLEYVGIGSPR